MPDVLHRDVSDPALSDADIARILFPFMARAAPAIGSAINRAGQAMIADGDLPPRAIEALHDLAHDIVTLTEEMGWAADRRLDR